MNVLSDAAQVISRTPSKLKQCGGLKCAVPALKPGEKEEFRLDSSIVEAKRGAGGTYVRVRADLPSVEANEKTCANNQVPGRGGFERVTIEGA